MRSIAITGAISVNVPVNNDGSVMAPNFRGLYKLSDRQRPDES